MNLPIVSHHTPRFRVESTSRPEEERGWVKWFPCVWGAAMLTALIAIFCYLPQDERNRQSLYASLAYQQQHQATVQLVRTSTDPTVSQALVDQMIRCATDRAYAQLNADEETRMVSTPLNPVAQP